MKVLEAPENGLEPLNVQVGPVGLFVGNIFQAKAVEKYTPFTPATWVTLYESLIEYVIPWVESPKSENPNSFATLGLRGVVAS